MKKWFKIVFGIICVVIVCLLIGLICVVIVCLLIGLICVFTIDKPLFAIQTENDGSMSKIYKEVLDDMHKRKIDMSDEIFVINVNGYIGESTKSEIEYAIKTGKKVNYLENV